MMIAIPTAARIERLSQTFADLERAIQGQPNDILVKRPTETAWSATEIVCHLRDVEEAYLERIRSILANDEPTLLTLTPDRWVAERQYDRQDAIRALAAFRIRREESLALLNTLTPEQWEKAGAHALRGRMTVRRIVHGTAKHDDEHLDQLRRALNGRA